jgi:hypothetical protein
VRIDAPRNIETVISDDPEARILRVHCVAYLSPPGTTSPTRPMLLPDLIEDVPIYRISITCADTPKEVEALNPKTMISRSANLINAEIEDIHEVLIIHY